MSMQSLRVQDCFHCCGFLLGTHLSIDKPTELSSIPLKTVMPCRQRKANRRKRRAWIVVDYLIKTNSEPSIKPVSHLENAMIRFNNNRNTAYT
ncbi:hypothetical protein BREU_2141 [Bifidobacterium reuteri DSM 23975]|uniref:Uncharacterized protein n=1 Tax=Bifidobacterium reuteri DSM 23975 TaxID=1437610 RepID=A0A087CL05_9BIFI|nr:hypothetical protein BREU_2141 [Bifidobacterium reuteri DSM 23975]